MQDRISSRLVNKLIILFSAIIILVVSALTVISYQMLHKESINNSISSTTNNLKLVNQNLEDYVKEMEQLSLPQVNYDELTYAILHESEDYASKMYIEDYLRSIFVNQDDLMVVYMYIVQANKYYEISRKQNDISIRAVSDDTIVDQIWYEEALKSPHNRAYQSLDFNKYSDNYRIENNDDFFAYHRVLRSIVSREPQAVLTFYYNSSVKDMIIADVPIEAGEQLFWLNESNEVFVATDAVSYHQLINENVIAELTSDKNGQFSWSDREQKYLVVYDIGKVEGWKLIKQIPYNQINNIANKTRNFSLMVGIAFLILAMLLVIILSNQITKPLKKLSLQMKRFSSGDFEAITDVVGNDELAYISHRFNQMVSRTNELINERYKLKLAEKNAILKALEAEINPHFLYNALQAISTKALKHGQLEIVDMVDSLALSLRYCISGKDIVSAEEELKHIGHYLNIQKARFGERLQVTRDWDDQLLNIQVPKLSIQTLVENAVKHGLEKISTPVTIFISAEQTETEFVITVTNNGPTVEPSKLKQIKQWLAQDWEEALSKQDNIGLINLNARLKLLYGNDAQLVMLSDELQTSMLIILPRGGQQRHV
ncbi:sensor histidine kinase [Paenibacillus sp. T3-5-0-4]|nr:sensor histidine kinase [Paenibacillus endoradicis]